MLQRFSWFDPSTVLRLLHQYGTRITSVLQNCSTEADLGIHFGQGLYEKEVLYLHDQEWASCAEDILWRRTQMGLLLNGEQQTHLANYLAARFDPF